MKRGFLNTSKAKDLLESNIQSPPVANAFSCSGLVASLPDVSEGHDSLMSSTKGGLLHNSKTKNRPSPSVDIPPHAPPGVDPQYLYTIVGQTIPPRAPNLTMRGGSAECYLHHADRALILNKPGFPRTPLRPTGGRTFRTAHITNGKRSGMSAMRDLSGGDLILDERPLIICPQVPFLEGPLSSDEIVHIQNIKENLRLLVDRMPAEDQKAFFALANYHESDGGGPFLGRLWSNSKSCLEGIPGLGEIYVAVCKDLSRANHSCSPNAVYRFDNESLSMRLYAIRDIPCGSEITVGYTDLLEPATARKSALAFWNMSCKCRACTDPAIYDERRARFKDTLVLEHPNKSCRPGRPKDAWLQPAKRLLEELEEDGLESTLTYSQTVAQLWVGYSYLADAERALLYGKRFNAVRKAFQQLDDETYPLELYLNPVMIQKTNAWRNIKVVEASISAANLLYIGLLGLD